MRRTAVVSLALGALLLTGQQAAAATRGQPSTSGPLFRFADPRITESSGLATSSYGDGRVYTHNDSGDSARFFAVNATGATVAVYTLRGATNVDWEDMAAGTDAAGKPVLYLADIGDNDHVRSEIDVYQVAEPRGPSAAVSWVRYRFRYPDGSHDAETLMVDPRTHQFYIATKEFLRDGELYSAPPTLSTTGINLLTPLRSVPPLTTSGDFSPDGRRVVLLTYLRAYWATDIGATWHGFDVPLQSQDEAITVTRDGGSVLVGSEGLHSAVYSVALPSAAMSSTTASPAAPRTSAAPSASAATVVPAASPSALANAPHTRRRSHLWWWVVVAVVLLVAVALLGRRTLRNRAVHITDADRHD